MTYFTYIEASIKLLVSLLVFSPETTLPGSVHTRIFCTPELRSGH